MLVHDHELRGCLPDSAVLRPMFSSVHIHIACLSGSQRAISLYGEER